MKTTHTAAQSCTTTLSFEQGDVTTSGWRTFHAKLSGAVARGAGILVLDLKNVRYVFSGVLNSLVDARVKIRNLGGAVVLVVNRGELREFLASIGFDRLFTIVDEDGDVVAALSAAEAN